MITVIIRNSSEQTVIDMTMDDITRQLSSISGAEIMIEDSWTEGLRKVRTPMVCLVEADCVLSAGYMASNVGLLNKHISKGGKGGGYNRLAMVGSCIGVKRFDNRIYHYNMQKITDENLSYYQVRPVIIKPSSTLYQPQVAFVPGAIMRMRSLAKDIDTLPWDIPNLVEMSTRVSFHLWQTNRFIETNPNTTYVSGEDYLEDPPRFDPKIPQGAEVRL